MKTKRPTHYIFKIADCEEEFQQIHRLNYQTFSEEIPQHEKNEEGILVDKFHENNTYLIIKKDSEVIGMVCVCDKRPFSIEQKLEDFESYLPESGSIFETRLLALKKEHRGKTAFSGLVKFWYEYSFKKGYDLSVVSATLRQMKLYRHMGFKPFGPQVGTKEAPYQPMYLFMNKENSHSGLNEPEKK